MTRLLTIARFPRRASGRAGFSMVELIAVIVIGLILASVAMAGVRIYERDLPVRQQASRLVKAFASARSFAIANNSFFAVQYSPELGIFWIDETDAGGGPLVHKVMRPESIDDKVAVDAIFFGANAADLNQDRLSILFRPDGSSDDVRIFLRMLGAAATDATQTHTVRLYGPTGQARVFENQRLEPTAATP